MPCIINGVSEERLSPVVAQRGAPVPLHNSWSRAVKWHRGKLSGHLQMSVIFEFAILWRCIRAARMLLLESPHSKMSHFDHRSSVQIKSDSPPPPLVPNLSLWGPTGWIFAHETNLFYDSQDKSIEPAFFCHCAQVFQSAAAQMGLKKEGDLEESWGQCIIKKGLDRTTCLMQPDPYYKLYVSVQRTLGGVQRRSEDSCPHGTQRQYREGRRRKLFITRDKRGQSRRLSNFSCVSRLKIVCSPVLSMPSKS